MSEQDKQQDLLREREIESILEETHYLADQEKMEQTAQKYRAKPKMDEIFSNADKKPRLKNDNPLDVDVEEAEIVADTTKTIVGEKNAATIQASLLMDGTDYRKCDFSGACAIVIGNEGKGISRLVREKCDVIVSLPMKGKINSLNASVAAGILMYRAMDNR